MEVTDQQKLGVGLGGFGVFFLLLGVTLLFDKGLLAIGNLFCIAGNKCRFQKMSIVLISIFRVDMLYWNRKDNQIFFTTRKFEGILLFFWRNSSPSLRMANNRNDFGGLWICNSIWRFFPYGDKGIYCHTGIFVINLSINVFIYLLIYLFLSLSVCLSV